MSGPEALSRTLSAVDKQSQSGQVEIIVPFIEGMHDLSGLMRRFPNVNFIPVRPEKTNGISECRHHLFDRLRAVGLLNSKGSIVAMTEDHAIPNADWCDQIVRCHTENSQYSVIGGAIENAIDRPLNWAWYYCDFGRYGRPFASGERDYISDVNVSYKRDGIMAVSDTWKQAYHETSTHWAMMRGGEKLYLDDRIVVFQNRPDMTMTKAFVERIEWGQAFAETRVNEIGWTRRYIFALGSIFLPILLSFRALRNMLRQSRSASQMIRIVPFVFALSVGWAVGELYGYVRRSAAALDITNSHVSRSATINL